MISVSMDLRNPPHEYNKL